MSVQISPVFTGTTANDGTGDQIQTAFIKVNNNFTNVATAVNSIQSTYANTTLGVFANITVTNRHVGSLNFYGSDTVYINGSAVVTGSVSFPGGNVTLQSNFLASTSSTSANTGAVVVYGGLGVGGNVYANGIAYINNSTDSASTSSGAIVTTGGLGVARNVNFGAALNVATSIGVTGTLTASSASITNTTVSAGTNTGALIVTGGVGIGGAMNVGGNVTIANLSVTGTLIANTSGVITAAALDLNTPVSLAPLTIQTTSNIGVSMHYYDSAGSGDSHAFVGRLVTGIGFLSNALAYYASSTDPLAGPVVGTQLGTIVGGSLIAANSTPSTSTTSGALLVTGGAGIGGNLFVGNISTTTVNAATIGNTGAVLYGTLNSASASQTNITAVGALNGLTINTGYNIVPNANLTVNLGSPTAYFGTIYAGQHTGNTVSVGGGGLQPLANAAINIGSTTAWFNTIYGTSTHAQYADLAENYLTDYEYEPGTVVVVGGAAEVTACTTHGQDNVIGAVSTNPAYLMNGAAAGQPIALKGRIPLRVYGPIQKGQRLSTSSELGHAEYARGDYSFAIALETNIALGSKVIEAIIL
jgi:hypothetical protein